MKLFFSLLLIFAVSSLIAQDNKTASFINSVHYNNKLNLLRTSYDRWQIVFDKYWKDDPDPYKQVPVSSAINDFNWAQDVNGKSVYPMSIGYALGKKYVRYYFLLSSSDLPNMWKDSTGSSEGNFQAATVGMNFNLKYATIQGDATYSENGLEYYGKVFSPQAKSHIGVGFSNYEELKGSVTKIVKSKTALFNSMDFNTSIVKYFNIGLRYYNISQVKYVPNINTALHQYINFDKWAKLPADIELFFETRGEKISNIFSLKDWETRLVYYQFIGGPLVNKKLENKSQGGICVRPALFVGVSYKSEEDGYAKTLTESGMVYNGQNGFGFEGGICLRALGFTEFGFKDASYVKFSAFYNYSQYYERFPGIKAGIKFRVLM